jgi:hypothetical protein
VLFRSLFYKNEYLPSLFFTRPSQPRNFLKEKVSDGSNSQKIKKKKQEVKWSVYKIWVTHNEVFVK